MQAPKELIRIISINISPNISTFDKNISFTVEYEAFSYLLGAIMYTINYEASCLKNGKFLLKDSGLGEIKQGKHMQTIEIEPLIEYSRAYLYNEYRESASCDIKLAARDAIGVHQITFSCYYEKQMFFECCWEVINERIQSGREKCFTILPKVANAITYKCGIFTSLLDRVEEKILEKHPYSAPLAPIIINFHGDKNEYITGKLIENFLQENHKIKCCICHHFIITNYSFCKIRNGNLCNYCKERHTMLEDEFFENLKGPFYVSCDNCIKNLDKVRIKCLECDNYDLCEKCAKKRVHENHVMVELRETRLEPDKIKHEENNCKDLISNLKNSVQVFKTILQDYLTYNNMKNLLDMQTRLNNSIGLSGIDEKYELFYNNEFMTSISLVLEELKILLMKYKQNDELKLTIELFFKNILHLIKYIMYNIINTTTDFLTHIVKTIEYAMFENSKKEKVLIWDELYDFLYNAEITRRQQICRKIQLKFSHNHSIRWGTEKVKSEKIILDNIDKESMKKEFYSRIDVYMKDVMFEAYRSLQEFKRINPMDIVKMKEILEMRRCFVDYNVPGLIPLTSPTSWQKFCLRNFFLHYRNDIEDYPELNDEFEEDIIKKDGNIVEIEDDQEPDEQ